MKIKIVTLFLLMIPLLLINACSKNDDKTIKTITINDSMITREDAKLNDHFKYERVNVFHYYDFIENNEIDSIYDANGNKFASFPPDYNFYDSNGNKGYLIFENSELLRFFVLDYEPYTYEMNDEMNSLIDYFGNNLRFPSYLPEGYTFESAEYFIYEQQKDPDAGPEWDSRMVNLKFSNNDKFFKISAIFYTTGGAIDGDPRLYAQNIQINGNKSIITSMISNDTKKTKIYDINLLIDDVCYFILCDRVNNKDIESIDILMIAHSLNTLR